MRTSICQCGCGQEIIAKDKGPLPQWIAGHGPTTLCECGCGGEITQKRSRRFARFLRGHGKRGVYPEWSCKPDSENIRTARDQSRRLVDFTSCQMEHIGGCKGIIEVHHKDKNPLNRDLSNMVAVCRSHHRLLDNGTITMESEEMPKYYEGPDGKRRYYHTNPTAATWQSNSK